MGQRVLLVDAADGSRLELADALERAGADVVQARTGREAIELLGRRRERIDALVVEAYLCDMTERELIDALLATRPRLRVFVVTSSARPLADATHIQRPCDPTEVARRVLNRA